MREGGGGRCGRKGDVLRGEKPPTSFFFLKYECFTRRESCVGAPRELYVKLFFPFLLLDGAVRVLHGVRERRPDDAGGDTDDKEHRRAQRQHRRRAALRRRDRGPAGAPHRGRGSASCWVG